MAGFDFLVSGLWIGIPSTYDHQSPPLLHPLKMSPSLEPLSSTLLSWRTLKINVLGVIPIKLRYQESGISINAFYTIVHPKGWRSPFYPLLVSFFGHYPLLVGLCTLLCLELGEREKNMCVGLIATLNWCPLRRMIGMLEQQRHTVMPLFLVPYFKKLCWPSLARHALTACHDLVPSHCDAPCERDPVPTSPNDRKGMIGWKSMLPFLSNRMAFHDRYDMYMVHYFFATVPEHVFH